MKTISMYIGMLGCLLMAALPMQAVSEAQFRKLHQTYILHPDGSQEMRVQKELTLFTHAAMNNTYGETFIAYDPSYQTLKINESYTKQKDGTLIKTPDNAFVEVLPAAAAKAPAYNGLKEMVIVHTGLELGATIYLDYTLTTRAGVFPELDVCCPIKELSPIDEFICRLEVPQSKPLHYELLNLSALPKTEEADGMKSVTFTLKNVKPRPYAYPTAHNGLDLVQQVASGMMPAILASTYSSYADALKSFGQQFAAGDEAALKAKADELTKEAGTDTQKKSAAISQYMANLYSRLGMTPVPLRLTGYKLRPASEVIRSGYGTPAELANLDVLLQRAAGLKASIVVNALRPSDTAAMGLSGIVSVIAKGESDSEQAMKGANEQALSQYMTVTDLNGAAFAWPAANAPKPEPQQIRLEEQKVQELANGYQVLTLDNTFPIASLYAYASTTSIAEPMLLPNQPKMKAETTVTMPEGTRFVGKAKKEVSNDFGTVTFEYAVSGQDVKVTRSYSIEKQLITPAEYSAFYHLIREWKDSNNHTLLFQH